MELVSFRGGVEAELHESPGRHSLAEWQLTFATSGMLNEAVVDERIARFSKIVLQAPDSPEQI
jgi:hypothetical protein